MRANAVLYYLTRNPLSGMMCIRRGELSGPAVFLRKEVRPMWKRVVRFLIAVILWLLMFVLFAVDAK